MSTIAGRAGLDRSAVERVVREVVLNRLGGLARPAGVGFKPNLLVNISARHMHITQETLEILFGPGAQLTVMRPLLTPIRVAASLSWAVALMERPTSVFRRNQKSATVKATAIPKAMHMGILKEMFPRKKTSEL